MTMRSELLYTNCTRLRLSRTVYCSGDKVKLHQNLNFVSGFIFTLLLLQAFIMDPVPYLLGSSNQGRGFCCASSMQGEKDGLSSYF